MKKVFCIILVVFIFNIVGTSNVSAEQIEYPFDSIRITSAYKFECNVTVEPDEASILFGNVGEGETFLVYVGTLEFVENGVAAQDASKIIILTNESDEDFVAWIINSGSGDGSTYVETWFSSHITIDPTIGVVKNLDNEAKAVAVHHVYENDVLTFKDNLETVYPMIAGTYQLEENLDIVISAYEGGQ